jgi:hypothetical protein
MVYTPLGLSYQTQPGTGIGKVDSGIEVGNDVGVTAIVGLGKSGGAVSSTTIVGMDEGIKVGVGVCVVSVLQALNRNSPAMTIN